MVLDMHDGMVLHDPLPAPSLVPITQPEVAEFATGPIFSHELANAVRTLRLHAATGPDNIPNIVMKLPLLADDITSHINQNLDQEEIPDSWRLSTIVSIPKRGNSTSLDNQRGIAKSSVIVKVLNKILLQRRLPVVNTLILGKDWHGSLPGLCVKSSSLVPMTGQSFDFSEPSSKVSSFTASMLCL